MNKQQWSVLSMQRIWIVIRKNETLLFRSRKNSIDRCRNIGFSVRHQSILLDLLVSWFTLCCSRSIVSSFRFYRFDEPIENTSPFDQQWNLSVNLIDVYAALDVVLFLCIGKERSFGHHLSWAKYSVNQVILDRLPYDFKWSFISSCQRATCRKLQCVLVESNFRYDFELLRYHRRPQMDIDIVNTILRLCIGEQRCSFELSFIDDYCRKVNQCWNRRYILASMRNYIEIFRINVEGNRMEFVMPVCIHWLIEMRNSWWFSFSLKSVVGRNVGNYVQIYMFVTNISLRIPVVDRVIAHCHMN